MRTFSLSPGAGFLERSIPRIMPDRYISAMGRKPTELFSSSAWALLRISSSIPPYPTLDLRMLIGLMNTALRRGFWLKCPASGFSATMMRTSQRHVQREPPIAQFHRFHGFFRQGNSAALAVPYERRRQEVPAVFARPRRPLQPVHKPYDDVLVLSVPEADGRDAAGEWLRQLFLHAQGEDRIVNLCEIKTNAPVLARHGHSCCLNAGVYGVDLKLQARLFLPARYPLLDRKS